MAKSRALGAVISVVALAVGLLVHGAASASAETPRVTKIERIDDQLSIVHVYSPSMRATIPNQVLRPRGDGRAPVLYLLNGKGGGVEGDSWDRKTRYRQFFADKHVTVVSPLGGRYSWYANWKHPDPILGVNMWENYLIHELPAALAAPLKTNGRNAIAGLSHSGGPALDIAGRGGNRFQAAASYSGCPAISSPAGMAAITTTTATGGGNALNAFGPPGDPAWVDHDPSQNPERLRGKAVYLGTATGIPGRIDGPALTLPFLLAGPAQVELATWWCTQTTANALDAAGVAHTFQVFDRGAHTWALFEEQLRDSWRVIGPAIGA